MCGIIGEITKRKEKVDMGLRVRSLLEGLQHRGHESAGETITDGHNVRTKKDRGKVTESISAYWASKRTGMAGIGQVRYSTSGSGVTKEARDKKPFDPFLEYEDMLDLDPGLKNSQPFFYDSLQLGRCALVHNGNLTNAAELKSFLLKENIMFDGESDSEVMLKLICYLVDTDKKGLLSAIKKSMSKMEGAYSCIFLKKDSLWAFRDRKGFRPLEVAETNDSFIFSSEECAWHARDVKNIRSAKPGEIIEATIGRKQIVSHITRKKTKLSVCILCFVYLKAFYNKQVATIRTIIGEKLFEQHPLPGIVVPIMESGEGAALGYHVAQSQKFHGRSFYFPAIYKNPSVGRTFLEPDQIDRMFKNKIKYFFLFEAIKHIIQKLLATEKEVWITMVDDSLIRGTVSKALVKLARTELERLFPKDHERIKIAWLSSFPPYKYPCYFGIDTYERKDLIANNHTNDQIKEMIGVDYLGYINKKSLLEVAAKVLGIKPDEFCDACITGNYPIKIDSTQNKMSCSKK